MDPSLRLDDLTRHTQGLARLAGAILGDPDGGEDVAQEAVIRALRAARRPSRTEELRPWLRTITRRLALNERAARRSRTDRERARSGADVAPSTDEIVARAETAERLHAVVRGLSPAHSAVLLDRYVGGLTPTRIAERDGVSPNTVKARLRRALVELRDALDAGGLGTDEQWSIALAPLAALAVRTGPAGTGTLAHGAALLLGASLMTKILVPLVLALAVILGFVLLRTDPAPEAVVRGAEERVIDTAAAALPESSPGPDGAESRQAVEPAAAAPEEPSEARPKARLHGLVTDPDGDPVPDVSVAGCWTSWTGGEWKDNVVASARTDGDGRWSLHVALDGARLDRVAFEPGLFFQNGSIDVSPLPRDGAVLLVEGDNDLGVIALTPSGAGTGRVLDESGAPLAGATVELRPNFSSWYGLVGASATTTDAAGRFELGHAPVGDYSIAFTAPGRVSVLRSAAFRARERTALGDITLRAAGRVAGRVTDPEGAPIAAQRIMLDPGGTEERELTFLTTDADGVFDETLHAEGAHVVRFERDGFVPVGAFHGGGTSVTLEPGDVDAEIVLERATRTTFLVVDAITHEPLTEYWLSVTRGGGSEAEPRVYGGLPRQRARTHDGGRTERDAREAVDLVRAWAPGYLEFTGDVAHDSPGGGEQTVALVRGATIVGRVLVDGDPAAEVRVRVTDRPERRHAPAQETVTGIDGRFLIEGIRAGTQHVIADVRGDSLSGRTTVEVPRPTAEPVWLEAPDLHLERPGLGTVEGTVLLPPTVPADGLTVYWGHWADATPVPVRSDGTFTLEDVPEGPRELNVHGSEGLLADVLPTRIEVPRDGTVLATIDAAGAGKGRLALTLDAPGVDLTEVGFFVRHGRTSENPEDRAPRRGLRIMERFDADGRAEASVRASGTVFIELHVGDGPAVILYDQPILLQPGARVERTVRYTPSTLEIELPDAWLADGLDFVQLALWTEGQHEPVWTTNLIRDGAEWSAVTRIRDGRATLENVPVGRFRVALAAAGPEGWIRAPEDTTVDIRAGTQNRITLPGPVER